MTNPDEKMGPIPNWDEYFIKIAEAVSLRSKDPSVKVGCVIVGPDKEIRTTGYNGMPRKVSEEALRWERPLKYKAIIHAEENAILQAARIGVSLKGCSLYLNTSAVPCHQCARAIIQAGIIRVVGPDKEFPSTQDWRESLELSEKLLGEAGVRIERVKP